MQARDVIALGISLHIQIQAHRGSQRDLIENGAVVRKRVLDERVVVIGQEAILVIQPTDVGSYQNLAERKSDPLAQLIRRGDGAFPPGIEKERVVVGILRIVGEVAENVRGWYRSG